MQVSNIVLSSNIRATHHKMLHLRERAMIGSTRASRLYRQMLVMARALPEARRVKATKQITDGFHAGRDEDAAER